MAGGKYQELFALWVRGFPVEWRGLYVGVTPRRISLPTYPFASERYWAPESVRYAGLVTETSEPTSSETGLLLCRSVWRDSAVVAGGSVVSSRRVVLLGVDGDLAAAGEVLSTGESDPGAACCDLYEQLFVLIKDILTEKPEEPVLLQVVVPGSGSGALYAGVSGMLRSAAQESRQLLGQVIVLEGHEDVETLRARLSENASAPGGPEVRYSEGRRQVRILEEEVPSAGVLELPWKEGGVYLLTGGAGELGLLFAEEITRRTDVVTLVLTGRSALSGEREGRLSALREGGAQVIYERVDVTDRDQVEHLVQRVVADHGRLDGVLHTAGVLRDSYIVKKELSAFREVLAVKVLGTVNLDVATRDLGLDLFVLFSSGAAVFGNLGQADYAAANAFMDAYAVWRGRGALSVNWPLWADGGMGMDDATRDMMLTTTGMVPMPAANGFDALYRAIQSNEPQIAVMNGRMKQLRGALLEPKSDTPGTNEHSPASILDTVLQAIANLFEMELQEIDPEQDLGEIGFDSISYIRLANCLNQDHGFDMRPSDFWELRSVADIAAHLQKGSARPPGLETSESEAAAQSSARRPLSEGQQGLWLLQQAEPNTSAYNVPIAFRTEDDFDQSAFRAACAALWNHCDSLRTMIGSEDGVPYQTTAAAGEPPFYAEDLSRLPEVEVAAYVAEVAKTPFHLSGPLMRVHSFTRANEPTIVLIDIHHIIFDGVSYALFLRWLWEAYQAISRGEAPSLPRPSADYSDFVAWEQGMMVGPEGNRHLDYWRDHLGGDLPQAVVPFDHRRPVEPRLGGRTFRVALDPDQVGIVRHGAGALGVRVSVIFLAVFKILLSKYSNQEDTIVGMPTMGRQQQRFEALIGYFVNVIALRSRIPPEHSLRALTRDLMGTLLRGLDHAVYPFPAVVRGLNAKRLEGQIPIYRAVFAYQNAAEVVDALGWDMLDEIRQEGEADFGLEVIESDEGYVLLLTYSGDLFKVETIDRMARQYLGLLADGLENPDRGVAELSLLSAKERKELLKAWTPVHGSEPEREPVTEAFAKQVAATPDAPALLSADDPELSMSYRELSDRADTLAARLKKTGVRPGDRVGLYLRRSLDMVVGLLGILKAGAVFVPLDPDHPRNRVAFILSDCDIRVLLVDKMTLERLPKDARGKIACINLDGMRKPRGRKTRRPIAEIKAGEAAYVMYTSGSTGRPKGVRICHRALAEHCRVIADCFELSPQDRVLQFASLGVDTSLEQILPGLLVGACIVVRGDRVWTVNEFKRVVATAGITVADLPPTYLREILRTGTGKDFELQEHLRLVVVGGEAASPDTVRRYRESPLGHTRLINAYGPTEATVTCLVYDLTAEKWSPEMSASVPIGWPLRNTRVCILDRHGQPVPEGVAGELFVGDPRLADGYINRSELTHAQFVPDPFAAEHEGANGPVMYATGDMVRYMPGRQGLIEFIGRVDHQIKVRGHRVELGEIEVLLSALAGVAQAAVVALEDNDGDYRLVGFVVLADGAPNHRSLLSQLRATLPEPMVPDKLVRLNAMPLTVGGKVDRTALSLMTSDGTETPQEPTVSDAPDHPVVEQLARIWCDVLNVSKVRATDNFFDLGGHSILAVRLLSRVYAAFGRELPVASVLQHPTLRAQAALLSVPVEQEADLPSLLVELKRGPEGTTPFFCFHAVGGSVLPYRHLATEFGDDLTLIGLQSAGLCGGMVPNSVKYIAALQVAALRTRQPEGPYRLGGWSFGGVLAYEAAQQLTQAGEQVEVLALIDSYTPSAAFLAERRLNAGEVADSDTRLVLDFARDVLGGAITTICPNSSGMRVRNRSVCCSLA